MSLRIVCVLVLLIAVLPPLAQGQSRLESAREESWDAFKDIGHVWSGPLRLDGEDLPLAFIAVTTFGVVAANDALVQQWIRDNQDSPLIRALTPVREQSFISKVGLTRPLLTMSTGVFLAGVVAGSDDLRDAGLGCAASNLATTLPRSLVGRLFGRQRPRYGEDPYRFRFRVFNEWEMRSFPGGHAANIMSCAAFWNNRFDLGVAGPAVYVLAGSIGLARVLDEAHWASDSVVGIAWGWAVGQEIGGRFRERREGERARGSGEEPALVLWWRLPLGG